MSEAARPKMGASRRKEGKDGKATIRKAREAKEAKEAAAAGPPVTAAEVAQAAVGKEQRHTRIDSMSTSLVEVRPRGFWRWLFFPPERPP